MKQHVLLIAQPGSYRIAAFLHAAKSLNVDALIASSSEHSLINEIKAGLLIRFDDHENALSIIRDRHKIKPFSGIIGIDDSTVELATLAAQDLRLIHNPPYAAKLTQRKDLARACLTEKNCVIPKHCLINTHEPIEKQVINTTWPSVIKPLNMSASRGVIRVNNMSECRIACERVKKIISNADDLFERTHVLMESYIDGVEVAFEAYLQDGKLHQLAIFDKPNPLIGPYFEETIYVTPSQLDATVQTHIKQRVSEACNAYGLVTGPIHAELRIDCNNEAWILEVANRSIGGDCGRTLDGATAYFVEKLIISLALGLSTPKLCIDESRGVMMIPIQKAGILQKVTGIEAANNIEGITGVKINIKPGNELIPLPEGNQYLGYLFAQKNTPKQVIHALNDAFSELNFKVTPKFNLIENN